MPTNVYFDTGTKSEQRLYEDLIIEQLKIYNQDVIIYLERLPTKILSLVKILLRLLMTHILSKCMLITLTVIWVNKKLLRSLFRTKR